MMVVTNNDSGDKFKMTAVKNIFLLTTLRQWIASGQKVSSVQGLEPSQ